MVAINYNPITWKIDDIYQINVDIVSFVVWSLKFK